MVADGVFDSEALGLMQTTLEHAWVALPPDRQTAETRERIAQAVVNLAMQWERDAVTAGRLERSRARENSSRRRLKAKRPLSDEASLSSEIGPEFRFCGAQWTARPIATSRGYSVVALPDR
jgi:hypothetical protein